MQISKTGAEASLARLRKESERFAPNDAEECFKHGRTNVQTTILRKARYKMHRDHIAAKEKRLAERKKEIEQLWYLDVTSEVRKWAKSRLEDKREWFCQRKAELDLTFALNKAEREFELLDSRLKKARRDVVHAFYVDASCYPERYPRGVLDCPQARDEAIAALVEDIPSSLFQRYLDSNFGFEKKVVAVSHVKDLKKLTEEKLAVLLLNPCSKNDTPFDFDAILVRPPPAGKLVLDLGPLEKRRRFILIPDFPERFFPGRWSKIIPYAGKTICDESGKLRPQEEWQVEFPQWKTVTHPDMLSKLSATDNEVSSDSSEDEAMKKQERMESWRWRWRYGNNDWIFGETPPEMFYGQLTGKGCDKDRDTLNLGEKTKHDWLVDPCRGIKKSSLPSSPLLRIVRSCIRNAQRGRRAYIHASHYRPKKSLIPRLTERLRHYHAPECWDTDPPRTKDGVRRIEKALMDFFTVRNEHYDLQQKLPKMKEEAIASVRKNIELDENAEDCHRSEFQSAHFENALWDVVVKKTLTGSGSSDAPRETLSGIDAVRSVLRLPRSKRAAEEDAEMRNFAERQHAEITKGLSKKNLGPSDEDFLKYCQSRGFDDEADTVVQQQSMRVRSKQELLEEARMRGEHISSRIDEKYRLSEVAKEKVKHWPQPPKGWKNPASGEGFILRHPHDHKRQCDWLEHKRKRLRLRQKWYLHIYRKDVRHFRSNAWIRRKRKQLRRAKRRHRKILKRYRAFRWWARVKKDVEVAPKKKPKFKWPDIAYNGDTDEFESGDNEFNQSEDTDEVSISSVTPYGSDNEDDPALSSTKREELLQELLITRDLSERRLSPQAGLDSQSADFIRLVGGVQNRQGSILNPINSNERSCTPSNSGFHDNTDDDVDDIFNPNIGRGIIKKLRKKEAETLSEQMKKELEKKGANEAVNSEKKDEKGFFSLRPNFGPSDSGGLHCRGNEANQ